MPVKRIFVFLLAKEHKKFGRLPFFRFSISYSVPELRSFEDAKITKHAILWRDKLWIKIYWIFKRPYLQIYPSESIETLQTKSEWHSVNNCWFQMFLESNFRVIGTFSYSSYLQTMYVTSQIWSIFDWFRLILIDFRVSCPHFLPWF